MKSEWKTKWIEALRSGNFKQGKQKLTMVANDGTEYDCCLGVLCKVVGRENGLVPQINIPMNEIIYGFPTHIIGDGLDSNAMTLPLGLARFVGMDESNPVVVFAWYGVRNPLRSNEPRWQEERYSLSKLNDDGFTYDQIADLIERFL